MRENLSAPGSVAQWLRITREAYTRLNYHNITQDPKYARVSAQYGYDDYILINIRNKEPGRVLLEFEVSDPKLVNQFKKAAAAIIRENQRQRAEEFPAYTPPEHYEPETSEAPEEQVPDVPEYEAEEGDFVENTQYLPQDTVSMNTYHRAVDHAQQLSFKMKFEKYCNKLWFIWLMLIVLPPFGIFLIWYFRRMRIFNRLLVSVVAVLYLLLIWIGFFGIDTGLNKETIQKFYNDQQYRITRFFNEKDNEKGKNSAPTTDTTDYPELEGARVVGPFAPLPTAAPGSE